MVSLSNVLLLLLLALPRLSGQTEQEEVQGESMKWAPLTADSNLGVWTQAVANTRRKTQARAPLKAKQRSAKAAPEAVSRRVVRQQRQQNLPQTQMPLTVHNRINGNVKKIRSSAISVRPKVKRKPMKLAPKKITLREMDYIAEREMDFIALKRAMGGPSDKVECNTKPADGAVSIKQGIAYLNNTGLVDGDLSRFMLEMKFPPINRRGDKCFVSVSDITGLKNETGKNNCYNLRRANSTYLLIMGCGYSGTRATSLFFTNKLGVNLDHEWLRRNTFNKLKKRGVEHEPWGLVSWPATAQSLNYEPVCHDMEMFLQVRHPLKVVNSLAASYKSWDFTWKYGGNKFNATNLLPQRFQESWHSFSDNVRSLLWWLSLNLIGEAQVRQRHGILGNGLEPEGLVKQRIFRMEDVYEKHDIDAFKNIIARIKSDGRDPTTERLRNLNWATKTTSLEKAKKVNVHAKGPKKVSTWDQVILADEVESSLKLQREVITLAKKACTHYGYENCE